MAADASDPDGTTQAEMQGRRDVWLMFDRWKKEVPGFEDAYLISSGPYIGVRETRRIVGQYVLTEADLVAERTFEDGVATGCWYLDLHPQEATPGGAQKKLGHQPGPYDIPYRSLLPQKVVNLLVAGRCHSATQLAAASTRVTATEMDESSRRRRRRDGHPTEDNSGRASPGPSSVRRSSGNTPVRICGPDGLAAGCRATSQRIGADYLANGHRGVAGSALASPVRNPSQVAGLSTALGPPLPESRKAISVTQASQVSQGPGVRAATSRAQACRESRGSHNAATKPVSMMARSAKAFHYLRLGFSRARKFSDRVGQRHGHVDPPLLAQAASEALASHGGEILVLRPRL